MNSQTGLLTPSQEDRQPRKRSYFSHSADRSDKKIALFSHLERYSDADDENMHWAIKNVALKIKEGVIVGSNARCRAMLNAILTFLDEYIAPAGRAISRDLEVYIIAFSKFLAMCRPMSFGMETAIQFIKFKISQIPPSVNEAIAKNWLKQQVEDFIRDKIDAPSSIISEKVTTIQGAEILRDNDVILTFGGSSAVLQVLLRAKEEGKKIRVILADSRPYLEGKKTLEILLKANIPCTYILINSVSYHMREVTRVFIGASGLTTNGCLLNRTGTALICCIAHSFKKPVLVCSESYKFSDKVKIDSICYNDLGRPEDLVETSMYDGDKRVSPELSNWRDQSNLLLLNLKYDLTPPEYIDMIITEVGCIPVTSVPVILREFRIDTQSSDIDIDSHKLDSIKSNI